MSERPARTPGPPGPRPAPLRFFGTRWVRHDRRYAARRIGVAVGSLAALTTGCLLLRLGYQGLAAARVGAPVNLLVGAALALCTAFAFRYVWQGFARRPESCGGPVREPGRKPAPGTLAIGFLGALGAYFLRSLVEAPGEGRLRAEHERACEQHARRTARRTGDPARRRG
ncbi:hypothetical protein [Streptomyces sp. NPDC002490]|uniref:hypothetical protein n=1 Tax=Streptomyces sp. NPDC002490 TaxID=3154416 RepID=UPI003319CB33